VKVLLDEMLPVGVAELLADHQVTTAKAAGYTGFTNGELIRQAEQARYDVLVTADRNMPAQQNIGASSIAGQDVRLASSHGEWLQSAGGALRARLGSIHVQGRSVTETPRLSKSCRCCGRRSAPDEGSPRIAAC